ncbi:MAG: helix-turn-helix domain-containing protein [Lachnospiraceae bacterium]|nr:helix-turn-helix domain-containing protein [Lachnospiraceae bacterium]MDE6983039.1 helix-turn-helix domain-containing protein [Lachnospiraceae bacterium]MDE7030226.1 helix-turn-helix domain-containing protein [Lachnospiraceae bacterium]
MSGFEKDAFWSKILSLYYESKENNYILKLDEEQVRELKALYIDLYIPMENLGHYDDEALIRKIMTAVASMYKVDKDTMGNSGEIVQLVNTVNYDGKNMYIRFARISPVKMRRLELGKSRQQIAERMGYSISAVRNCEASFCDLGRQPEKLVRKLARALECEPEALMQ